MIRDLYKLWCRFLSADQKNDSFWRAEYLTAYRELVKANKGLRRLSEKARRRRNNAVRLEKEMNESAGIESLALSLGTRAGGGRNGTIREGVKSGSTDDSP